MDPTFRHAAEVFLRPSVAGRFRRDVTPTSRPRPAMSGPPGPGWILRPAPPRAGRESRGTTWTSVTGVAEPYDVAVGSHASDFPDDDIPY